MTLTAIIYPGEETDVFVAQNPETGTTTQGKTVQEAMDNLREAVALYLTEFPLKQRGKPLMTTFEVEPSHA
jgi:predicted RNase H-like HicB family nuclease